MRRLLLTLCFDGTNYHGWQVQNNADTVQNQIQNALQTVLGVRPGVTGCSRTDAGVHANVFYCHLDTDSTISCERLPLALNAHLPDDIAVLRCEEVASNFHARYNCKQKTYVYKIHPSFIRNPFSHGYVYQVHRTLDVKMLDRAAKDFIGTYDFSAFCASGSSVEDRVRTVTAADVYEHDGLVIFRVKADGFLYNMVRIMAGTLLDINDGKIAADAISSIIQSKDRENAGRTAPAHGLYLHEVNY